MSLSSWQKPFLHPPYQKTPTNILQVRRFEYSELTSRGFTPTKRTNWDTEERPRTCVLDACVQKSTVFDVYCHHPKLVFEHTTYVLAYLKMPLMSTSLTAAFTMGSLTSGAPNPTSTKTPPDFVDWKMTQELHVHTQHKQKLQDIFSQMFMSLVRFNSISLYKTYSFLRAFWRTSFVFLLANLHCVVVTCFSNRRNKPT